MQLPFENPTSFRFDPGCSWRLINGHAFLLLLSLYVSIEEQGVAAVHSLPYLSSEMIEWRKLKSILCVIFSMTPWMWFARMAASAAPPLQLRGFIPAPCWACKIHPGFSLSFIPHRRCCNSELSYNRIIGNSYACGTAFACVLHASASDRPLGQLCKLQIITPSQATVSAI